MPIPYGRQTIDSEDMEALAAVVRSDWLTTGPKVGEFEQALARFTGATEAVAVNSGTAALHCAAAALDLKPGDEVIVPAITFAATANCVVYCGGTPVFADVNPETLLIDPASVVKLVTPQTRAVIAVDYAGQPCDYDELRAVTTPHKLALVADACHALGASYRGRPVGTLGDLSTFSFHPVKPITTAEGGAITTNDAARARRMRNFRNHGITSDHRQREAAGSWFYEMVELGFNYRLNDLQCALGLAQLRRLEGWLKRREAIAQRYLAAFANHPRIHPLRELPGRTHGRHLFVVRVDGDRKAIFTQLREKGIGVQVHYIPVHLHPYYRQRFGTRPGQCPQAEAAYEKILSLPIFPSLADGDVDCVIDTLTKVVSSR